MLLKPELVLLQNQAIAIATELLMMEQKGSFRVIPAAMTYK